MEREEEEEEGRGLGCRREARRLQAVEEPDKERSSASLCIGSVLGAAIERRDMLLAMGFLSPAMDLVSKREKKGDRLGILFGTPRVLSRMEQSTNLWVQGIHVALNPPNKIRVLLVIKK